MKKTMSILLLAMFSVFLTGCPKNETDTEKLKVYTSFYAMEAFAKAVGGDMAECKSIVPTSGEAHDFEPTASDMAELSEADVFIYNGAGMEHWAEDIAKTLPKTVTVVCASDSVEVSGGDPHTWLSFDNAKIELNAICDAFSAADADNADYYRERTDDYISETESLKNEYASAGLEGKMLFVTHGAYGYLCREFGMEQTAIEGANGESDPSPAQMAEVVGKIKDSGAKCVFYDPSDGDKIAQAAAKEAGVSALPLYTFEKDTDGMDYVSVMRMNLEQLKSGL